MLLDSISGRQKLIYEFPFILSQNERRYKLKHNILSYERGRRMCTLLELSDFVVFQLYIDLKESCSKFQLLNTFWQSFMVGSIRPLPLIKYRVRLYFSCNFVNDQVFFGKLKFLISFKFYILEQKEYHIVSFLQILIEK